MNIYRVQLLSFCALDLYICKTNTKLQKIKKLKNQLFFGNQRIIWLKRELQYNLYDKLVGISMAH